MVCIFFGGGGEASSLPSGANPMVCRILAFHVPLVLSFSHSFELFQVTVV